MVKLLTFIFFILATLFLINISSTKKLVTIQSSVNTPASLTTEPSARQDQKVNYSANKSDFDLHSISKIKNSYKAVISYKSNTGYTKKGDTIFDSGFTIIEIGSHHVYLSSLNKSIRLEMKEKKIAKPVTRAITSSAESSINVERNSIIKAKLQNSAL